MNIIFIFILIDIDLIIIFNSGFLVVADVHVGIILFVVLFLLLVGCVVWPAAGAWYMTTKSRTYMFVLPRWRRIVRHTVVVVLPGLLPAGGGILGGRVAGAIAVSFGARRGVRTRVVGGIVVGGVWLGAGGRRVVVRSPPASGWTGVMIHYRLGMKRMEAVSRKTIEISRVSTVRSRPKPKDDRKEKQTKLKSRVYCTGYHSQNHTAQTQKTDRKAKKADRI
jgi:hypothetical protein